MEEYSFFLGYLVHLLTDQEWAWRIYRPELAKHSHAFGGNRDELNRAMKRDWYDLDFVYLKKHPGIVCAVKSS